MIKFLIKNHWRALVLAFCVGIIILLPTLLSIQKIGLDNFKGIYPMLSDDEDHYMAEVKEAYDGHFSMGNPYIKEYKETLYTQPPVGPAYYAIFAKVFNVSVGTATTINDFILPFIAVLLLYSLFFLITKSRKISLIFSAIFFISFISSFNRLVNPQLSFIFLLSGLCLIWLIVDKKYLKKELIKYNLLLSVIFGILIYIYPFYWMTIGVVYVLITSFRALIEKDFKYCLQNWIYFFIPAILWSVPFLLHAQKLFISPLFDETNLRNGFINTHIPGSFVNIAIMIICLPLVYLIWKLAKRERSWPETKLVFLGISLVLGGIILNWQNIITGKIIQFAPHFYPIEILFVCIILVISSLFIDIKKLSKYSLALLCLVVIFTSGIFYKQRGEILYALKIIVSPKDIGTTQNLGDVTTWLNDNTPGDSVAYVLGKDYIWAIPIYTRNNLYFNSNAGLSLMSDTELENRWVISRFFENIDENAVRKASREIWTNKFIETYQSKESRRKISEFITGNTYPETPLGDQSYIDRVLNAYNKYKNIGFEKAIKTYEVDYIVLDKSYEKYPEVVEKFKFYRFLTFLTQIGDTSIYKVN